MLRNGARMLAGLAVVLLARPVAPAAEPDRYLPENTASVLTVNVKQLVDSPAVRKFCYVDLVKALGEDERVQDALAALDFNPLADLRQVVVATTEEDETLVICHGSYDTARFRDWLTKQAEDEGWIRVHTAEAGMIYEVAAPQVGGQGKHGSLTLGVKPQVGGGASWSPTMVLGGTAYVAVVNKGTLVVATSKELANECLSKAHGMMSTLDEEMQVLLEKVDGSKTIWIAARAVGEDEEAIDDEEDAPQLESFVGEIMVDEDVRVRFTFTAIDAEEAERFSELVEDMRTRAAGFLSLMLGNHRKWSCLHEVPKTVVVTNSGQDVTVEGRLNCRVLEALCQFLRQEN